MTRALKLEAMRQWLAAVDEAQRERRAYSWHACFALRHERAYAAKCAGVLPP